MVSSVTHLCVDYVAVVVVAVVHPYVTVTYVLLVQQFQIADFGFDVVGVVIAISRNAFIISVVDAVVICFRF